MKLVYGFLIIMLVSIGLIACGNDEDIEEPIVYEYEDFTHFLSWDEVDDINHEDYWFVYIYLKYCGACIPIQPDMFEFAIEQEDIYPMYFVNAHEVTGTLPFNLTYVPALVIMQGDEKIEMLVGQQPILEALALFKAGSYS